MSTGATTGTGAYPTPPQAAAASYNIQETDLASLEREWLGLLGEAAVDHIFLTPYWVAAWWHHLGSGQLRLLALRQRGRLVAVVPLVKQGQGFSLAADPDVCDYADVVVRRGEEAGVAAALLDYLGQECLNFQFSPLLPQSPLLRYLEPLARERGYTLTTAALTPTVFLELPSSWEGYLDGLSAKERHEVRRKLRRLYGSGDVTFSATPATPSRVELFFSMFRSSRADKDRFLTPQREAFFRTLMAELEARGQLRLCFLEVMGRAVAAALCFEYGNTIYLYNSGFDPRYTDLSPGLMGKVLAIQNAIQRGKRVFDFLSGAETYKMRLGGQETPRLELAGHPPQVGAGP